MRRALAVLVAVGCTTGCSAGGLAFVRDERVEIVEPARAATVTLPFHVEWSSSDFDGTYAVFFDRSPMRPNEDLRSLVGARDCLTDEPCPSPEWLRNHNIYTTDETSLVVQSLPDERTSARSSDRHDLTIVLLDSSGRRSGESAFVHEFIVDRSG